MAWGPSGAAAHLSRMADLIESNDPAGPRHRNKARSTAFCEPSPQGAGQIGGAMNGVIYLIGLIVVIMAVLSLIGLR